MPAQALVSIPRARPVFAPRPMTFSHLETLLQQRLAERHAQHRYRNRQVLDTGQRPLVRVGGRPYLSFCSNDYLGLAGDPRLVAALQQGAERWGVGSGASHLISGHSGPHQDLEEALAEFTGRPRALLFSSGYMANMGVIQALVGPGDQVLQDELNHASLLDGGLLSRARFQRFRHADSDDVARRLSRIERGLTLVVTDGVFSMDGDLAPLPALAAAAQAHQAALLVDDAHGIGVLGAEGAGIVAHYNLGEAEVPILIGTLGKAFGTCGAFVAGSETLIEALIQFARTYIFTTALPPAIASATLASLDLVRGDQWRRERLRELVQRFRSGAEQLGLSVLSSPTPIQCVLLGEDDRVMRVGAALRERGLLVGTIRPPTVPAGTARLRITLCATHTDEDVDALLQGLADVDV